MPRSNFNTRDFQGSIAQTKDRLTARALNAVRDELDDIYDESQVSVPVITGALKASGHVQGPHSNSREISGSVVYDKEYAAPVHENPRSKGWKYLEKHFDDAEPGMTDRIANKVFR